MYWEITSIEKQVKKKFIDEPGQMKLLIVVDKDIKNLHLGVYAVSQAWTCS